MGQRMNALMSISRPICAALGPPAGGRGGPPPPPAGAPGLGARGPGGRGGDLVINFQVRPHHFFRRDGLDIHCTVPINIAQAVLGSKIRVSTLDGKKVTLKIPPGTQPGTRFRIPGQGIARAGRTGDQYVEVKVEIPDSLTEEGKERVRALADEAGLRH
jgi:molecular chaperone DnaJ